MRGNFLYHGVGSLINKLRERIFRSAKIIDKMINAQFLIFSKNILKAKWSSVGYIQAAPILIRNKKVAMRNNKLIIGLITTMVFFQWNTVQALSDAYSNLIESTNLYALPAQVKVVRSVNSSGISLLQGTLTSGTASSIADGEGAGGTGYGSQWYTTYSNLPLRYSIPMVTGSTISIVKLWGPWGWNEWVKDVEFKFFNGTVLLGTESFTLPDQYSSNAGDHHEQTLSQTYNNVTKVEFRVISGQGYNEFNRVSINEIVFMDSVSDTLGCSSIDSDGDGIGDLCDLDDDNDGILDLDELCPPISGSTAPQPDNITWSLRGYDVYTIGGNTNGLGYKESGFEQGAKNQGKNLTILNGPDNFTASHSGDGTAILSTVTFANGFMKYTSNHPVNGRAEFRDTTAGNFISGSTGDGAYIEPEMGPGVGDYYSIEINFTTAVTAFSLDIIDAFDTFTDNDPVLKYQVYADGNLIAYLEGRVIGDDLTGNVNIFDANGNLKGVLMVGQDIETTIGFVTLAAVKKVEIRHDVTSGFIRSISYDPHGLDGFAYSTDFCDTDNDGIPNHLDVDSDNDGCPDALEAKDIFDTNDLDANKRLSGGVDANGVPSVTSGGQATTIAVTDASDSSTCSPLNCSITYHTTNNDKTLYKYDVVSGVTTLIGDLEVPINGIGLNPKDGFLYGQAGGSQIAVINPSDASLVKTISVTGLPDNGSGTDCYLWTNGDVTPDGNYYVNHTGGCFKWVWVDIRVGSPTYGQVVKIIDSPDGITWHNDMVYVDECTIMGRPYFGSPNMWTVDVCSDPAVFTDTGVAVQAGSGQFYYDGGVYSVADNGNMVRYDISSGTVATVTALTGANVAGTHDAASCRPLMENLTGYIYQDDGDSQFSSGDVGLGLRILYLLDTSGNSILDNLGNPVIAVTSNGNLDVDGDGVIDPIGYYSFNIEPGTYTIFYDNADIIAQSDGSTDQKIENLAITYEIGDDDNNFLLKAPIDPCDAVASGNLDSDGDGISDLCDLDDDNDGILDTVECTDFDYITGFNGDMNYSSTITNLPNHVSPDGWLAVDGTPDVAQSNVGLLVDGKSDVLTEVPQNGGSFLRMVNLTGLPKSCESVKRVISGFTAGEVYYLELEQSIIHYWGTSDGYFDIELFGESKSTPLMTVGVVGTMKPWEKVTLGPFIATSTSTTLYISAVSKRNGVSWGNTLAGYPSEAEATDLTVDGVKIYTRACDFDGDGILNHLDIDSDNDGCPDALESNGNSYTYSDLNGDGKLLGAVNTDSSSTTFGVPNSTSFALGTSQDNGIVSDQCNTCAPGNTFFIDSDGDGIGDDCDLDDDNDGILDSNETTIASYSLKWGDLGLTDSGIKNIDGQTINDLGAVTGINELNGISMTVSYSHTGVTSNSNLIDEANLGSTFLLLGNVAGEKNNIEIVFSRPLSVNVLYDPLFVDGEKIIFLNSGSFESPNTIPEGIVLGSNSIENPFGGIVDPITTETVNFNTGVADRISFETNYDIRSSNSNSQNAFIIRINYEVNSDADNDGIPNRLDLDSDNDGCPDALESDGNSYSYSDLNEDGSLSGAVDTDATSLTYGVPNSTSFAVGTSQVNGIVSGQCNTCAPGNTFFIDSDGDGIGNDCDLDDDNDGILDSDETTIASYSLKWGDLGLTDSGIKNIDGQTITDLGAVTGINELNGISMTVSYSHTGVTSNSNLIDEANLGSTFLLLGNVVGEKNNIKIVFSRPLSINVLYDPQFVDGEKIIFLNSGSFESPNTIPEGIVLGSNSIENPFGGIVDPITTGTVNFNTGVADRISFETNYDIRSSNSNSQNAFIIRINYEVNSDADNDGIPNRLDLDSDNDGCPDALESDGNSYSYSDLKGDGSLSGAVDTDATSLTYGVPNSASFAVGTSQDDSQKSSLCDSCAAGNPAFVDSDGDGIGNLCDLDDDNDGITDFTECSVLPTRVISETLVVESGNGTDLHTGDILRKSNALTSNGVVYDVLVEIVNENVPTGKLEVTLLGGLRIAEADYKEHPFVEYKLTIVEAGTTTPATLTNVVSILRDIDGSTNGGFVDVQGYDSSLTLQSAAGAQLMPASQDFTLSTAYTTFRTVTPTNMISSTDPDYWVGLYHSTFSTGKFVFGVNQTGDGSTSTNRTIFHDLLVECDSDNDGIPNRLDLDSDNDGCPDALESDGNSYSYSDLNGDGSLSGAVDTDATSLTYGVPNSTSFAVGTSQDDSQKSSLCDSCAAGNPAFVDSDGDGIGNLCDLDDDNDGITDFTECSVLPTRVISETLVVESGNGTDLHTGDILRKSNALTSNGVVYDVLIEIVNENVPTGKLEVTLLGGLRIAEADYKEHPFVEYKLTIVEAGTTTSATLINVVSILRDIDGSTNGGFVDVQGYDSSLTLQSAAGAQLMPTSQDFTPSTAYTTFRTVTPTNMISSTDPDYWVGLYHSTFSTGKFVFGVNQTGDGSTSTNRTIFHDLLVECDSDNDGVPNRLDLDSDNDGIYDVTEAGTSSLDTNNDGRIDNMDNPSSGADADGDGLADTVETTNGENNGTTPRETTAGTPDFLNSDSDNDGCSDANEAYNNGNIDGTGDKYYNPTSASEPLTVVSGLIDATGKVVAAGYTTGDVSKVTDKDALNSICNNTTNAVNDFVNTNIGQIVTGNVLTNDYDLQGNTQTVNTVPVTNTSHGTLTLNSNGTFSYQPNAGFVGEDSFVYEVCDNATPQACDTATVFIEILSEGSSSNEPPIANPDTGITPLNTNLTGNLLNNDYDPDGDVITINTTPIATTTNGTLSINSDGSYTYTPNNGFVGEDSFEYEICDSGSPTPLCDTTIVTITVTPVTDNSTIANDDAYLTTADVASNNVTGNVLLNDTDPEGNTQTVNTVPVVNVSNGTLTLASNGTFTYQPNAGFYGQDSFVYEVCDNGTPQACDSATVIILVRKFLPPDYFPTLFTNGTIIIGATGNIDFVVAVGEANNQDANGINPVELRISDSANFSFTFENTLTTLNGMTVHNADWSYVLEGGLHKFTYIGNGGKFPGNTLSKIGVKAVFNSPSSSVGKRPLKVTIKANSGGQVNTTNDNDEDIIEYNNNTY